MQHGESTNMYRFNNMYNMYERVQPLQARARKKAHNMFPLNQVVSIGGVTDTSGQ